MYAGHIGVALGARSLRRTVPFAILLIAAQIPDWLDVGMCIVNADRGPYGLYTHGIVAVIGAAIVASIVTLIATRDAVGALLVAGVVASHYVLDYFTGIKPTWSGGPVIGLYLYTRPLLDIPLEGLTVLAGWLLYRRTLPPDSRNSATVYAIIILLMALQLAAGIAFAVNLGGHMKC